MFNKIVRNALVPVALLALLAGCQKKENVEPEAEAFSFVVYPNSRYLGQLTEMTKQAHKTLNPANEPPPIAIYDTDKPVDEVASYYAKEYGYNGVAPDATNNLSAAKPPAFYRSGDLATDAQAIKGLLEKMKAPTDISKAQGAYRAADIAPRPNRPRVTVQRPYFDSSTSQVVDRTLILMSK
ncbi:MAG: hypothetical protein QOH21_3874 [Acidobacteriota bacterium]|nr:hypothetical protein [Acidobacteriota bacterium]